MLNNNVIAVEDEDKSGYYVTLELYQYREGELIDKRIIEDDYILRNLVHIFLLTLSGDRYGAAPARYPIYDINGVLRTGHTAPGASWFFTSSTATIRLGTGSNPVSITNYALQTQVMEQVVDDGEIWITVNQFNVTADSTMIADGAYAIRECGLSSAWREVSLTPEVLLCRDVFSAINVDAGDVITVRYIFRFN